MCGFIGKISTDNINEEELKFSNRLIQCRGPDSKKNKHFKENEFNFSLIFNRLSILDLSENADQPMSSNDGNSVLMFNGEIFNHQDLRKELETKNIKFNTNHSDSEVILHGLEYFGKKFISQLRGQFSIFYINKRKKTILLARDRVGQKPLYYHLSNNNLVIGSNLIAVSKLVHNKTISQSSINEYLMCGVISSPNTIFENIQKLKPAEIIEIGYEDKLKIIDSEIFWKLANFVDNKPFQSDEFFSILSDSISIRNLADVPIANFLSGGIDSSLIVMFQSLIQSKPNTFSVGYEDAKYDESKWSNLVSEKYSTNHDLMFINIDDLKNLVDDSLNIFDEPYADPSVLPSYSISKLISQNYKVAISGDGGDELSGGYLRTHQTLNSINFNHAILKIIYDMYPSYLGSGVNILRNSDNKIAAYSTYFEDKKLLNLLKIKQNNNFTEKFIKSDFTNYKNLMFTEYKFYLAEQMMLKVDRTSMASSLEVRSPFVDHRIVEYLFSTDEKDYISKEPKFILKHLLADDFNSEFLNRKKMGFVFNVEDYIKNNILQIQNILFNGLDIFQKNSNQIKKLSTFYSRTNALRLWKMFTLQKFINSLK